MFVRDYHRERDGVKVAMEHDEYGRLKPLYIIHVSAGSMPLHIEALQALQALLNEHMTAFEEHAERYAHP